MNTWQKFDGRHSSKAGTFTSFGFVPAPEPRKVQSYVGQFVFGLVAFVIAAIIMAIVVL